jgi:serine/threonine-protein kinase HipA
VKEFPQSGRERDAEASYLDLAEFIASQGIPDRIAGDLEQLFRRVAFNVLIGNRDDHFRNHAFIREKKGWRLSPVYDVNPNPAKSGHALRLDESTATPEIDAVRESAVFYRLTRPVADRILDEVREVVRTWREDAGRLGLSRTEIDLMGRVIQSL